jgi:hypothetical protein
MFFLCHPNRFSFWLLPLNDMIFFPQFKSISEVGFLLSAKKDTCS